MHVEKTRVAPCSCYLGAGEVETGVCTCTHMNMNTHTYTTLNKVAGTDYILIQENPVQTGPVSLSVKQPELHVLLSCQLVPHLLLYGRLERTCVPCHIFLPVCVIRFLVPTCFALSNVWYLEHIHKHGVSFSGGWRTYCPFQGSRKGVCKLASFGLPLSGRSSGAGYVFIAQLTQLLRSWGQAS